MINIKIKMIVILLTGLGLSHHSCTEVDNPMVENNLSQVESKIQSKLWRITFFSDSGKDETDHFNGYTFSFEKEGKLISDNGTNRFEGSWKITDYSSDDSEDVAELIHISGGNGGTDLLTFQVQ